MCDISAQKCLAGLRQGEHFLRCVAPGMTPGEMLPLVLRTEIPRQPLATFFCNLQAIKEPAKLYQVPLCGSFWFRLITTIVKVFHSVHYCIASYWATLHPVPPSLPCTRRALESGWKKATCGVDVVFTQLLYIAAQILTCHLYFFFWNMEISRECFES